MRKSRNIQTIINARIDILEQILLQAKEWAKARRRVVREVEEEEDLEQNMNLIF